MSVYVVRAFVQMREEQAANAAILKRMAEIDKTLLTHDVALRDIYQKLRPLLAPSPEPEKRARLVQLVLDEHQADVSVTLYGNAARTARLFLHVKSLSSLAVGCPGAG